MRTVLRWRAGSTISRAPRRHASPRTKRKASTHDFRSAPAPTSRSPSQPTHRLTAQNSGTCRRVDTHGTAHQRFNPATELRASETLGRSNVLSS